MLYEVVCFGGSPNLMIEGNSKPCQVFLTQDNSYLFQVVYTRYQMRNLVRGLQARKKTLKHALKQGHGSQEDLWMTEAMLTELRMVIPFDP